MDEPIILVNGKGRAAGPVNNVAVMSAVSSQYAPPGAHLVIASVVGEAPAEDAALVRLDQAVRLQIEKWFGPVVNSWRMLGAYMLARTCPCSATPSGSRLRTDSRHGGRLYVWRLP